MAIDTDTHSVKASDENEAAGVEDAGAPCGGWRRPRVISSGISIQVHKEFGGSRITFTDKQNESLR